MNVWSTCLYIHLDSGLGSVAVGSACSTYSETRTLIIDQSMTFHLSSMVPPLCWSVGLTGSDNGSYCKLPEGLLSLASDSADNDLLPKGIQSYPFLLRDFHSTSFIVFSLTNDWRWENSLPVYIWDRSSCIRKGLDISLYKSGIASPVYMWDLFLYTGGIASLAQGRYPSTASPCFHTAYECKYTE